jgi:glutamate synthase (NADPH/NADH) large chain
MSLNTVFGSEKNIFEETADHAKRIEVSSPVLSFEKFKLLTSQTDEQFRSQVFDLTYDPSTSDLKTALAALAERVVAASRGGVAIAVLSDRAIAQDRLPIHALFDRHRHGARPAPVRLPDRLRRDRRAPLSGL